MRPLPLSCALLAALLALPAGGTAVQKKKPDPKKAEPRVTVAVPLGVAPGATTRVTVRGLLLEKVKEVRAAEEGVQVKVVSAGKAGVPDKNPEKVGDTQVVVDVTVPAGHKTPVALVVVTDQGETKPHQLLVETDAPLVKEKEPNDGFRQAQAIQVPQVVEGVIDRPRDVDVYRFEGKAGQRLVIELLAARYGSGLDGQLTLYDGDGQQVAGTADQGGRPDPCLEVTLPRAGPYYVSLLDAHDSGGPAHVYRLAVRPAP